MGTSSSGRGGLPPHLRASITRLAGQGVRPWQIAKQLGVNYKTVQSLLKKAHLAAPKRCACGMKYTGKVCRRCALVCRHCQGRKVNGRCVGCGHP